MLARAEQLEVVKSGKFKLSSGLISDYYVDGRLLSLDSYGAALIGRIINNRLAEAVKSVGGPAVGAVSVIASVLATAGRDLKGFYIRPQAKTHGRQSAAEGRLISPVTLIDDTCTTGASLLRIARDLRAEGVVVESMIAVFDRGGGAAVVENGYAYSALLSAAGGKLTIYQ